MTREKAIKEYVIPALKHTWNEKINKEVLEALEQEPKKGHWITHHPLDYLQNDTYMCSECGRIFYDKRDECPMCGAKMYKENMDDK